MADGKPAAPIEPIAVNDTVATDLEIEDMGFGLRRLVWTAPHPTPGTQSIERHIVIKLVVPEACLVPVSKKIADAAEDIMENLLTLVPAAGGRNHTG